MIGTTLDEPIAVGVLGYAGTYIERDGSADIALREGHARFQIWLRTISET